MFCRSLGLCLSAAPCLYRLELSRRSLTSCVHISLQPGSLPLHLVGLCALGSALRFGLFSLPSVCFAPGTCTYLLCKHTRGFLQPGGCGWLSPAPAPGAPPRLLVTRLPGALSGLLVTASQGNTLFPSSLPASLALPVPHTLPGLPLSLTTLYHAPQHPGAIGFRACASLAQQCHGVCYPRYTTVFLNRCLQSVSSL